MARSLRSRLSARWASKSLPALSLVYSGADPSSILEHLQDNLGNRQAGMTATGGGGVHFTMGAHPLALLSTLLNFDRHGDAVYSQEELDRVISQLVEQNMGGSAPPPASQSAISSLPKKPVDKEMLGHEGKAECSICMDAVEIGTEVTVLPCTHWFHYTCIEMWLNQHNTCPHCRRPIDLPYVSLSAFT